MGRFEVDEKDVIDRLFAEIIKLANHCMFRNSINALSRGSTVVARVP